MEPGATDHEWSRIEELFASALDVREDEREALLAEASAADADLVEQVRRLLRAHREVGGFLDHLDTHRAAELLASEGAAEPEIRLGAYRIVREIGRGGMGTVYLAERADGAFEQRVALKRIKRGLDTDLVLQRFVHERQILAHLAHPNIARLLDGGSDDQGLPYFAMEYVEGAPLTEYVQANEVGLGERLRLFLAVCDAVRYAHRNLVVHRDLKPSNIFVAADGSVKLLDFGIARLMQGEGEDSSDATQLGMRMLTPAYAAPEQLRGGAITTATDVYALGVVLYELLTDVHPHPRAPGEGAERPSGDDAPAIAPPSRVCPRWRRLLKGDLDWIVQRAMREDPLRRYATVDALMDDVRAHLEGRVIAAGPESLGYRLGKTYARHRARFLIGALVGITALAALAMHTVQLGRARDQAEAEAARAGQIADLLVSLFAAADPWSETHGSPLTAQDIVERGQERARRELRDQPQVEAAVLQVLGTIQRRMGNFDRADTLLTRSLLLRDRFAGERPDDRARSQHALGQLRVDRGEYEQAERLFTEAIAELERSGHRGPFAARELASMRNDLGALLYYQGRYAEAERVLRDVLRQREAAGDDPDLAYTLNDLALVLIDVGSYSDAESLLTQSLALHERLRGALHPDVASTANNLGLAYDYQERLDEAERWYRHSLESYRAILGDQHPQVALIADNLGAMLSTTGNWDASYEMLSLALSIRRTTLGEQSLAYGETLSNLGHLWKFQGEWERAEPFLREAIPLIRHHVDQTLPLAAAVYALGDVLGHRGAYEESVALVRESILSWTQLLGPDTPRLAVAHERLGHVLFAQGLPVEAVEAWREALRIEGAQSEPDATVLARITGALERAGSPSHR